MKRVKKEHWEDQEGSAREETLVCVCVCELVLFIHFKLERGETVPPSLAPHAFATLIQRSKVTLLRADKVLRCVTARAAQRWPSVYVWGGKLEEARGTEESTVVLTEELHEE